MKKFEWSLGRDLNISLNAGVHNAPPDELWNRWVFRGHQCSTWGLSSALERTLCKRFGMGLLGAEIWERRLSREFQRKAHGFLVNPPNDNDHMEWLALMQHYGAPTRLLDWTYSFWTAVFFALENAKITSEKSCAVWALQIDWRRDRVAEKVPDLDAFLVQGSNRGSEISYILNAVPGAICGIWPLNAYRLNERVVAQQALFIVPLDVTKSFEGNLLACSKDQEKASQHLIKFVIPCSKEIISESTSYLYNHNLTSVAFFPDIAGYARSIANLLLLHQRFRGIGHIPTRPWPE